MSSNTDKEKDKTQFTSIMNETGAITTDAVVVKRITREYYEQPTYINLTT